jgi:hypothetical protein
MNVIILIENIQTYSIISNEITENKNEKLLNKNNICINIMENGKIFEAFYYK